MQLQRLGRSWRPSWHFLYAIIWPVLIHDRFGTEPDGTDGGNALDSPPRAPRAIDAVRLHRLSDAEGRSIPGRLARQEEESGVSRSLPPHRRPKFGFAVPDALGSRGVRLAPDHGSAFAAIVTKASLPPGADRAGHCQVVPGTLASGMPLADRTGCSPRPPLPGPGTAADRAPCSVIGVGRQAAPLQFVGRCRNPWIGERPGLEGVARVSGQRDRNPAANHPGSRTRTVSGPTLNPRSARGSVVFG